MGKQNKIWIGIVIFVTLAVGAYFMMSSDDQAVNNQSDTAQQGQATQSSDTSNSFDVLATQGMSFLATISTSFDGNETLATMEYDQATGNTRYKVTNNGMETESIFTDEAYYVCQEGTNCFSYPIGQGDTFGFDPSTFEYDEAELTSFANTASYQGRQACPAGSCDVWQVTENGFDSNLYIDTSSRRISKVEGNSAQGTTTITYEYKDVSVVAPTNALPIPGL